MDSAARRLQPFQRFSSSECQANLDADVTHDRHETRAVRDELQRRLVDRPQVSLASTLSSVQGVGAGRSCKQAQSMLLECVICTCRTVQSATYTTPPCRLSMTVRVPWPIHAGSGGLVTPWWRGSCTTWCETTTHRRLCSAAAKPAPHQLPPPTATHLTSCAEHLCCTYWLCACAARSIPWSTSELHATDTITGCSSVRSQQRRSKCATTCARLSPEDYVL